ncbi:MAG: DNA topoisomerase IV subunit A [Nitrososphaerota archaeon]|nr:DNA topoisomerase IV subunit A [Nitrososphaerota archaeon]
MPAKKKANKRQSTGTAESRQSVAQGLLRDLGESVYSDMDEGRFPSLTLASRSVRNIVYDKKLQQFVLGATTVKKSSGNIKHIRPFTQLVWLAYFAKKLVDEKRTSTLRDVFYSAQAFNVEFQDQAESDELITDLEVLMQMAREGMNIYPEERSAIFGDMKIEYTVPGYEGKLADLSANPDGVMIGPALTTAEFRDTDAELVLAIEKGGLFTRFIEERVHQKYKAILINTAGQPPRSTRYLIRRLNQELGLPVGVLCDADPWGAHIAMVIKSGSVQRDEPIIVRDSTGRIQPVPIGQFVDDCIEKYGCYYDSSGNEICGASKTQDSNRIRVRFWHGTPDGVDRRRRKIAQNRVSFNQ